MVGFPREPPFWFDSRLLPVPPFGRERSRGVKKGGGERERHREGGRKRRRERGRERERYRNTVRERRGWERGRWRGRVGRGGEKERGREGGLHVSLLIRVLIPS